MVDPARPDEESLELAGRIVAVEGLAAEIGLRPGDELLAINDQPLRDVIDVQFYAAEPYLELLIRREGELWLFEAERDYDQPLGLEFEHPTFDTPIRRCNNRCLFCFVTQMISPFGEAPAVAASQEKESRVRRFRRSLYIKDDDYRYSFLEGNYVTLTNLTEADWVRIEEQRLSPLYVSVHATDVELRRKLLDNPAAPDVMPQLRQLAAWDIELHTQLVIVPGMNDGEQLARSVQELAQLWPAGRVRIGGVHSVSVVPVGLTRFHRKGLRTNTPAEAAVVLESVAEWQEQFLDRLGDRLVYATDEWYLLAQRPVPPLDHYQPLEALRENGVGLVREFLDEWGAIRKAKREAKEDWVTLVTGTLFASVLRPVAAEWGNLHGIRADVRPVVNKILGESVTVAGLLMGQDVVEQLQEQPLGDRVVLPAVMFRGPGGVTLDDMTVVDMERALNRPVSLAAGMNDLLAWV